MKRERRALLILLVVLALPIHVRAETPAELQAQINTQNAQIDSLNKEIAQYEAQLKQTTGKKKTLQSTINQLTTTRKKITASISVAKNKIGVIEKEIQGLAGDIADTQTLIAHDEDALTENIRIVDAAEEVPLVIRILSEDTLAQAWQDADAVAAMNDAFRENMDRLSAEKRALSDTKTKREGKKEQLVGEKETLVVQQGSLDAAKKAQNELLAQTKSQETAYQKLIAQKKAQEASLEAALTDLKAKFEVAINPSQITPAGKGVLRYPVESVIVTQYFGYTKYARNVGYNGKGHNGKDLGIHDGTPIKAALAGTIAGTGNTDAVRGCYSFGKWVLVKHANGLDTLYAHLSQVSVSQGQTVSTGQLLGYSGETGYATGPHLHFGVYVGSAVKIMRLGDASNKKTPCSGAMMPIAPLGAYLNPMSYL